jgi:hypothetical protein
MTTITIAGGAHAARATLAGAMPEIETGIPGTAPQLST